MSQVPPSLPSDRDLLAAWRQRRDASGWDVLVGRYLGLVYASALRRTGRGDQAAEVTRAVFLALGRRARKLPKRVVLADWLHQVTAVAARKLTGRPHRARRWPWGGCSARSGQESVEDRLALELDAALDRLPRRRRAAVLLREFLGWDWALVALTLGIPEDRARQRAERGGAAVLRRLGRRGVPAGTWAPGLEPAWTSRTPAVAPPEELVTEILEGLRSSGGGRPRFPLARRTLAALAWARWRRRLVGGVSLLVILLAGLGWAFWHFESRSGHSRLIAGFLIWSARTEARRVPGLRQEARPWPAQPGTDDSDAGAVRSAADLYRTTNLWPAHLRFTAAQWRALEPRRIGALPHFFQPDGTVLLRHPGAQRSGLAGVLGYDFDWSSGNLELGGRTFTNVAVRIKGNGTYLASLHGDKRSFKVDLNRHVRGQKLGPLDELNFHNLVNDYSCLSDALGYEFFREAGVPAPRTAYAYLGVSVDGRWARKPLGLYVMVEPVDEEFLATHFGSKRTPLFKPVTYELFGDLGDAWTDYAAVYDLKTEATPAQQRRLIEFARLVSQADDAGFARRVGEFLDLERFARYLAVEVLLSNYDGFLSDGQNFYLYLDPVSNRFGFIPWDLDLSWGGFFLLGTARERERASIWHPWVGRHRFLERMFEVEEFRRLYRAQLEELLGGLFVPDRLHRRIDVLAALLRGPVAAESDFRLGKFEEAVGRTKRGRPGERSGQGADRPAHPLKAFIEARALSVRQQLDGTSPGVILARRRQE